MYRLLEALADLQRRGNDGGRRLDDANDFVRREMELALEQGKKVIPVLFDDTPVPSRDRLPDPLRVLASCDALTLRGKTYEYQTSGENWCGCWQRCQGCRSRCLKRAKPSPPSPPACPS